MTFQKPFNEDFLKKHGLKGEGDAYATYPYYIKVEKVLEKLEVEDVEAIKRELATLAFEQGKLAGKKELVELLGEQTMHTFGFEDISEWISAKRVFDWLKSQLKAEALGENDG